MVLGASLLLVGCTGNMQAAYQEALSCWATSEKLGIFISDGSIGQIGVDPDGFDQARRKWAAKVMSTGRTIGRIDDEIKIEMNAALRRNEAASPKHRPTGLAQRTDIEDFNDCMKRL